MGQDGLFGLVAKGVGFAAEYHQYRTQQKSLQQNSAPRGNAATSSRSETNGARRSLSPQSQTTDDRNSTFSYDETIHNYSPDEWQIDDDKSDYYWDEAADSSGEPPSYEEIEGTKRSSDDLAREVLGNQPRQRASRHSPIPYPVIIPQRRPGNSSRGFVRAYAPVLGEYAGIDQDTFLTFLKNFHRASQASPIFTIIQVSAGIAGFAPSAIATIVCMSVGAAAKVGAQVQERVSTNNFLDKINKTLFMPRGLFAMIVKYEPDAEASSPLALFGFNTTTENVNTAQMITSHTASDDGDSGWTQGLSKLNVTSGTTRGVAELPEAAPLIFFDSENAVADGETQTYRGKAKQFKKFVNGYMDNRAQVQYAHDNPGSALTLPESQRRLRSQYSDPTHPIHTGGLVGLVSGGRISEDKLRSLKNGGLGGSIGRSTDDRRTRHGDEALYRGQTKADKVQRALQMARGFQDARGDASSSYGRSRIDQQVRGAVDGRSIGDGVKRAMKQGVLYLMVVNMPSEAELVTAREQLGMNGQRRQR